MFSCVRTEGIDILQYRFQERTHFSNYVVALLQRYEAFIVF